MTSRIFLMLALIGAPTMVTGATCEGLENVDERLSCLEEQYCADTKSDAERAQCYEDIVRGLLTGTMPQGHAAAESEAVPPAPAAPASPADEVVSEPGQAVTELEETTIQSEEGPEDAFGRRLEPVYIGKEPTRMGASITTVVEQRNGRLLIGLDNGQVWEENEASPKRRMIKIGSAAEVSKITFGYIMRFERGGSMRVRRLTCDSPHAKRAEMSKCKRAGYKGS